MDYYSLLRYVFRGERVSSYKDSRTFKLFLADHADYEWTDQELYRLVKVAVKEGYDLPEHLYKNDVLLDIMEGNDWTIKEIQNYRKDPCLFQYRDEKIYITKSDKAIVGIRDRRKVPIEELPEWGYKEFSPPEE